MQNGTRRRSLPMRSIWSMFFCFHVSYWISHSNFDRFRSKNLCVEIATRRLSLRTPTEICVAAKRKRLLSEVFQTKPRSNVIRSNNDNDEDLIRIGRKRERDRERVVKRRVETNQFRIQHLKKLSDKEKNNGWRDDEAIEPYQCSNNTKKPYTVVYLPYEYKSRVEV